MSQDDITLKSLYKIREDLKEQLKKDILYQRLTTIENVIVSFGGSLLTESSMPTNINNPVKTEDISFDVPQSYSDELTWEQKTIFALSKCNNSTGFVTDIIDSLCKYDKAINKDDKKVFAAITTKASILGRRGWFSRKDIGGRYKYSVK